jgi:hypothetical protein
MKINLTALELRVIASKRWIRNNGGTPRRSHHDRTRLYEY